MKLHYILFYYACVFHISHLTSFMCFWWEKKLLKRTNDFRGLSIVPSEQEAEDLNAMTLV